MPFFPVENATHYEVSLWRMSTSNTSLILERRASMGWGNPLAQGTGSPWLLRGALGQLKAGDEAGASACNRYGCSRDLLLRPSEILLKAAAPSWWSCKCLIESTIDNFARPISCTNKVRVNYLVNDISLVYLDFHEKKPPDMTRRCQKIPKLFHCPNSFCR